MASVSSFSFDLEAQGHKAKLHIKIGAAPGIEEWRCHPTDFLGAAKGTVAWRKNEIGLFSASGNLEGAFTYGVLVIPQIGLDNVAVGMVGDARFENWGPGKWVLKNKWVS
ncbi:hypothetical protein [Thalassovita aquimarina]|uniref:Uncharacterized protein n=1 Tax=Thalassovita aquimarina TaxID=2785917 RepID=A0ABS5HPH0_9RHOB|nr:hypothetical protein [Thalassovita aquimarina]MBR9650804.1 hypothetical protein [Thalassovita aquimarina]